MGIVFAALMALSTGSALWLALAGPGADHDSYLMIATWWFLLDHGIYVPSRGTGYPVAEAIVGTLALLDIDALLPLAAWLASLGALFLFARSLLRSGFSRPAVAAGLAFIVVCPSWIIAASSAMDHIWMELFFWAGVYAGLRGRLTVAAALFAATVGCRFAFLPSCALLLALAAWRERRPLALAVFAVPVALLYVPGLVFWSRAADFLTVAGSHPFSGMRNVGAFTNHAFLGLGGLAILVAAVAAMAAAPALVRLARTSPSDDRLPVLVVAGAILVPYGTLVLLYPQASDYMTHLVPPLGILVAFAVDRLPAPLPRSFLAVAALLGALNPFVTVTPFREVTDGQAEPSLTLLPPVAGVAARSSPTTFEIGLFAKESLTLRDRAMRPVLRDDVVSRVRAGDYIPVMDLLPCGWPQASQASVVRCGTAPR